MEMTDKNKTPERLNHGALNVKLNKVSMQLQSYEKEALCDKVVEYLSFNAEISQKDFANMVGISEAHVTWLKNRDITRTNTKGHLMLSENVFRKVAAFFNESDSVIWEVANFKKIVNTIIEAKKFCQQRIIDGPRGTGKTKTSEWFSKKYPHETYYIKSSSDVSAKQFLVNLAKVVGVDEYGSRYSLRVRIGNKLLNDKEPILIIDESENLPDAIYGSLKDLYDYNNLYQHVAIIMLGANDYMETLKTRSNRKNRRCYPQFISRFSDNPVFLSHLSLKETAFVCKTYYGISDGELIRKFHMESGGDMRILDRNLRSYLNDRKLQAA